MTSTSAKRRLPWFRVAILLLVCIPALTYVGCRIWLYRNAPEIEVLIFSTFIEGRLPVRLSSPSGPNDWVLAQLRNHGLSVTRSNEAPDWVIDSISPTGVNEAKVALTNIGGSMSGGGWTAAVRRERGVWKIANWKEEYVVICAPD